MYVFKINDRIQMEQYRLLSECLLPAHMLDWFDLQNVCVEKKDDTQVIHIYLDEKDRSQTAEMVCAHGTRKWVNLETRHSMILLLPCMTVRMKFSTILLTAPPMRQQNPSMQKSSNSGHCYVESLTRDSSYSD